MLCHHVCISSHYLRCIGKKDEAVGVSWAEHLTHFILETPEGVLAKSADQDQMPHNVASDLGLPCFASCSAIFQQKYLNIT